MKHRLTVIAFLSFILVFYSCSKKEMRSLNIDIVTKGKISSNPLSLMPEEIKLFMKPIEIGELVYIPEVSVLRTDLPKETAFKIIIPKESANEIRYKFGTYDYGNLKDDYNEYFQNMKIGDYLSKNSADTTNTYPYSSNDFIFYITKNSINKKENNFNNADTIVSIITALLSDNKFDFSKKVIVVINKGSSSQETSKVLSVSDTEIALNIREETNRANSINEPQIRLDSLESINIRHKSNQNLNYWSFYELAKNRIEGSKHEEAFAYLKRAAELAISKREGEIFLGRIKDDTESDLQIQDVYRRGAWRLTTGHPDQWAPVREALEHNDATKLQEMGEAHEHEHHHH